MDASYSGSDAARAGRAPSTIWSHTRGSGIPALFLHGLTIDHRMMLPLDPVFADTAAPWRRIYLDLPGHGHSPRTPAMSIDEIVGAVRAFIIETIGDEPLILIGASFGGAVCRALNAELGEQVLGSALLAPAVLPRGDRTLPARTTATVDPGLLAELDPDDRAAFTAATAQQDRLQWARFAEHVRPGLEAVDRRAIGDLNAHPMRYAPPDDPVEHGGHHLIVTGRQDGIVGWSDQFALLPQYPHATYAVLDQCGHNPHLEHPAAVDRLLRDWLHAVRV